MRQDQRALATGVGRRFLIELEARKPSCQLGRSLLVAQALGISLPGLAPSLAAAGPDGEGVELPEVPELPVTCRQRSAPSAYMPGFFLARSTAIGVSTVPECAP
jgi:hypothetical protein